MIKLTLVLFLFSCSQFVQMTDDQYFEQINSKGADHVSIIFSHNINGETHPCGCRKFPLGGLPQINGVIKHQQSLAPTLYVDTGDTFFETTIVPKEIKESSSYKANEIAKAMDLLDLKLFTPGDQDFAQGEDFLVKLSQKHHFKFLISNSSQMMRIKHQKLVRIDADGVSLFFIGVLEPSLLKSQYRNLFTSPKMAIKNQIETINKQFSHLKNKRIILLSHSGMKFDESVAQSFPSINWIIGAHTQSYLTEANEVNQTKIVQVLSRNHHLGQIKLGLSAKAKNSYQLIEIKDHTKDLIKNNKFVPWLNTYKSNLDKIHLSEQNMSAPANEGQKLPTYISCSDCHTKQVEFWQSTAHSLALLTLKKDNSLHNPQCIKCHSLGFKEKGGFSKTDKYIHTSDKNFTLKSYWDDFNKTIKVPKSVRKLSPKQRKTISQKWLQLDTNKTVLANHGNVQCLNCHNQNAEHPFGDEVRLSSKNYQTKCLNCHTTNQSPAWYNKDTKGIATTVNEKYFSKKLKEVSCPKIENK